MSDISIQDCRPEVQAFAVLMEERLRMNDHKPGWKGDHPLDLMARLEQESDEVYEAIRECQDEANEAADVANFAMMVADVCGGLRLGREEGR